MCTLTSLVPRLHPHYLGSLSDRMFSKTAPSKYSSRVSLKVAKQDYCSQQVNPVSSAQINQKATPPALLAIFVNFNAEQGHEMTWDQPL